MLIKLIPPSRTAPTEKQAIAFLNEQPRAQAPRQDEHGKKHVRLGEFLKQGMDIQKKQYVKCSDYLT